MRTLYLLRHAKSDWSDSALDDPDRPLAPRGRRAARLIAKHVHGERIRPELVLCSSARRARETLERIEPALPAGVAVLIEDGLYSADAVVLLRRLHRVPQAVGSVLVIGHNPGLEVLAATLARDGPLRARLDEKFATGALATLSFAATSWRAVAPADGDLVAFVVPRDLG